jgi:hypothetical protein
MQGTRRRSLVLLVALVGLACLADGAGAQRMSATQCGTLLRDGGFEGQQTNSVRWPWYPEGRVGIDRGLGYSYSGTNNAWARNLTGWNAIRQPVKLVAGSTYYLDAHIRTSGNVRSGYFGFRDQYQHPVSEFKFGPLPGYAKLTVQYTPSQSGTYFVFAGFWALGQDAWIQVDAVDLFGPCNDTAGNPASN